MTLEPLLSAPLTVQIHVATVVPAVAIGAWLILLSRKGAPAHRVLGYLYLVLMAVTAVTALFISEVMPDSPIFGLSPIHLFVPLTFYGIYGAIRGVQTGDIRLHRRAMISLYCGGILLAGGTAFMPGRIMHGVLSG
jgi:uncharacterized membrane protein